MATSQCVGPTMAVSDNNVLDVRLAGTPSTQSMPSTGNSLRIDTGRGIWAPAEHKALQIYGGRTDSHGGVIVYPGNTRRGNVLSVSATNPSPSRSMLALVTFDAKLVHSIAKTVTSGWSFDAGFDVDSDPSTTVALVSQITRRDQGITTGEAAFVHTFSEAAHVVIGPGATARIRYQVGVASIDTGYVKVTQTWQGIKGIGVTL